MLSQRHIVLGVSGSIAAYKACYLARLLREANAEVWPVLTPSATRFVAPLSLSVLTGHRAIVDLWAAAEAGEVGHVELAHRADAVVLAPATADLLARLAQGRADDPLSAVVLATRAPLVIAPAMEEHMWNSDETQAHVQALKQRGARFVEPGTGALASGRRGVGRLAEPEDIVEALLAALSPHDLEGTALLVTAGPTREAFDPARFISNASSGKMGFALARVAQRRGATVTLVTGPTQLSAPPGVEVVPVTTTQEMLEACQAALPKVQGVIMAAAPADYRPAVFSKSKLKKTSVEARFAVDLENTPDVLRALAARAQGKLVVGFAAESGQLVSNAQKKLMDKDLDFIVANDITRPDAGFAVDTNAVVILDRDGASHSLPVMTKEQVADAIFDRLSPLLPKSPSKKKGKRS